MHISVDSSQSSFDGAGAWAIKAAVATKPATKPVGTAVATQLAKIKGLQTAVHIYPDGAWGAQTNLAIGAVRYFARSGSLPWGVKALQHSVGTTADGLLGSKTRAAAIATVKRLQKALGIKIDGSWGTQTEKAFLVAWRLYYNKF